MGNLFNYILLLLLIFRFVGCTPENNQPALESNDFEFIFNCGAEEVDNEKHAFPEASGDSLFFGNVNALTNHVSHTGKFSLRLTREVPYGFTTHFTVGPDEYIQITAWRKCTSNGGAIAIGLNDKFHDASRKVIEKKENGWEKVFIEMYSPPHLPENKLTVFVWNVDEDIVYFDDIQIVHKNRKEYPEFSPHSILQIYTDKENLEFFNQKRKEAFQTGVLVNNDEDYAGAVVFYKDEFLNGDIRLKGDMTDHIQGEKWSFRIKLKKDFAWNNVRTFSVHNPATRGFLHEWVAHQIFAKEDVLTTRYGFVPVVINNVSRGIYAWEEHFEKHLVENSYRREGPIIRFNETLFWNRILDYNKTGYVNDVDYFNAAKITPFKEGSLADDTLKVMQVAEASKLMEQYRNLSAPVSEVFDVELLAKYYALTDVTQGYHGFS